MMLKYLIQTSIFRYSKNYGSLTHETRIKDAVNMGDLICLLATVRTLNTREETGPGLAYLAEPKKILVYNRPGGHSTFYLVGMCDPNLQTWGGGGGL